MQTAVKAFQVASGLEPDGVPGRLTEAAYAHAIGNWEIHLMTVAFLWILFLVGIALQITAIVVFVKAIGPLGLLLSGMAIVGTVMVALTVAWGILGEIMNKFPLPKF